MIFYSGLARSNWFKVKSNASFRGWAKSKHLKVRDKKIDGQKHFCIYRDALDLNGWPSGFYDAETDQFIKTNFAEEVARHLQDGSVAVLMEAGAEGLGYLEGRATAINSKCEQVTIDIQDIYKVASHLGSEINEPTF